MALFMRRCRAVVRLFSASSFPTAVCQQSTISPTLVASGAENLISDEFTAHLVSTTSSIIIELNRPLTFTTLRPLLRLSTMPRRTPPPSDAKITHAAICYDGGDTASFESTVKELAPKRSHIRQLGLTCRHLVLSLPHRAQALKCQTTHW